MQQKLKESLCYQSLRKLSLRLSSAREFRYDQISEPDCVPLTPSGCASVEVTSQAVTLNSLFMVLSSFMQTLSAFWRKAAKFPLSLYP